jgi:hypothetical protein
MSFGAGTTMMRAAAVIPVVLLVLFTGLLWLLGLMCGRERRRYVTNLSQQALNVIGELLHGPPPARQHSAAVPATRTAVSRAPAKSGHAHHPARKAARVEKAGPYAHRCNV